MPLISSDDRTSVGREGRVFIETYPWHQTLTDVTVSEALQTARFDSLEDARHKVMHISSSYTATLTGYQYINDDRAAVVPLWKEGEGVSVLYGETWGVGQVAQVLQLVATGHNYSVNKDQPNTMTLNGSSAGPAYSGTVSSHNLSAGVSPLTKTNGDLTWFRFQGTAAPLNEPTNTHEVIGITAATQKVIVGFTFKPISGWSNLVGTNRVRLNYYNFSSPDFEDVPGFGWETITQGGTIQRWAVTDPPSDVSDFDHFTLKLDAGALPAGQTDYDLAAYFAVWYILI